MGGSEARALTAAAWVNALLHLAGLLLALFAIRPGSPLVGAAERAAYVAGRPTAWTASWADWGLCALALVVFLGLLTRHAPPPAFFSRIALALAAAGAAVDLLCDALNIVVLPQVAAEGLVPLFFIAERTLAVGGVVVANGLYSLAVLLVTIDLRSLLSGAGIALGGATFLAGSLMAAGGISGNTYLVAVATAPTILFFVAFSLVAARDLGRAPGAS